jgi:hypothetical protein
LPGEDFFVVTQRHGGEALDLGFGHEESPHDENIDVHPFALGRISEVCKTGLLLEESCLEFGLQAVQL